MNKYLLLRDNKQTGPFSVADIIEKGIKPYDLVWVEGKSAAWRYPSEIEELKAHAPAIEEQPFERFYKKPEPAPATEYARFEPQPTVEPIQPAAISKKIYINFPGSRKKPVEHAPVVIPESPAQERPPAPAPVPAIQPPSKTNNQRSLIYIGIAACFLLLVSISYFIIDNNSQKKNISELNALVHQLEQQAKEEERAPVAIIQDDIRPVIQKAGLSAETIQEPVSKKQETPKASKATTPPVTIAPVAVALQNEPIEKTDAPSTPANLFKLVSVKSNKYKTGVLGGISNLQLELTNNSQFELHKVAVEVKYLGPEKKVVRTQTVFFENVQPGAQSIIDVPKSNRGVTVECIITDIKS